MSFLVVGLLSLPTVIAHGAGTDAAADTATATDDRTGTGWGTDLSPAVRPAGAEPVPLPVDPESPAADRDTPAEVWSRLTGLKSNVIVGSAPPPRSLQTDNGHTSELVFECPSDPGDSAVSAADRTQGFFTVPGCPLRIIDVPNPLSSPALAVHPRDQSKLAFFSLHGQVMSDGPTERSRLDDSQTTFTSGRHGTSWTDQPIASSDRPKWSTGEYATGAIDQAGNVYVGYAFRATDTSYNNTTGSILWFVKAEPITGIQGATLMDRETNVKHQYAYRQSIEIEDAVAEELHMVRVDPARDRSDDPSEEAGQNGTRRGDAAVARNGDEDRVVAIWPAVPLPDENGTLHSGYVDAAWSEQIADNDWTRLNETQRIGPCIGTGRPAQYEGKLFIPCVVGPGYEERARARIGDIDIWSLDPFTGETEYLAFTGLTEGHPMLSATPDGYMTLMTSGFVDNESWVQYVFGYYGHIWEAPSPNIGRLVHGYAGGGDVRDARVTGLTMLEADHMALFIYHERRDLPEPPQPQRFDPEYPPRPTEYAKTVVALNRCDGVAAASRFPLGDGMMSFHWEAYQRNPGAYNDIQDGLVTYKDPVSDEEYVHFAINDYGSVQYGMIIGSEAAAICPVHFPPAAGAATVVPSALEVGAGVSNLVGATIGVLASVMVAYLLTVKRRTAQYSATEDDR